MTKAEKILEKLELDLLEKKETRLEERKKLIPITDRESIKTLIWNLSYSTEIQKSFNDYKEVLEILFKRLE
jgi:hypothetical protein